MLYDLKPSNEKVIKAFAGVTELAYVAILKIVFWGFESPHQHYVGVTELADVASSNVVVREGVRVRISPPTQKLVVQNP